jgi:hypothetical protein
MDKKTTTSPQAIFPKHFYFWFLKFQVSRKKYKNFMHRKSIFLTPMIPEWRKLFRVTCDHLVLGRPKVCLECHVTAETAALEIVSQPAMKHLHRHNELFGQEVAYLYRIWLSNCNTLLLKNSLKNLHAISFGNVALEVRWWDANICQ